MKSSTNYSIKFLREIIEWERVVVQLGREPYFRSSFQASSTPKGCALSVY